MRRTGKKRKRNTLQLREGRAEQYWKRTHRNAAHYS
jgi:hypothetical protein